jgi:hypothetical protein
MDFTTIVFLIAILFAVMMVWAAITIPIFKWVNRKLERKITEARVKKILEIPLARPDGPTKLSEGELIHLHCGQYPYYLGSIYEGPIGGMSQNLMCATEGCFSRFNVVVNPAIPIGEFVRVDEKAGREILAQQGT